MKKSIKQLTLVLIVLALALTVCLTMFSCDNEKDGSSETDPVIPGVGTSETDEQGPLGTGVLSSSNGTTGTTSGTSGSSTVAPPQNLGAYENPLTGLRTDYDSSKLRPIAVVVDNIAAAYSHQTGLLQADIVYETLVSPGISRFTALISNYSALTPICNIREAYVENIDIVGNHNAILVAHGGSAHNDFVSVATARLGGGWSESLGKNTYGYINTAADVGFTVEGGAKYGTIKYYSKIRAEFMEKSLKDGLKAHYYTDGVVRTDLGGENGYDTLLTTEGLMAVFASKNSTFKQSGASESGKAKGFNFVAEGEAKIMNGAAAQNIAISMSAENAKSVKSVAFAYDAQRKVYLRSQDGAPHKDSATGKQLSFTNVITLFTDVTCSELKSGNVCTTKVTGSGTGYYFYGGEAVEIEWSKSAWNSELILTDKSGNRLELARGTTYIGYVDAENETAVSYK